MTFLRSLAISTALSLTLAACQNSATSDGDNTVTPDEIFRVDAIPHAQLPGNVVPQSYRVDMKMDPDADGFSGVVEIDVEILKPTDKIWLHGKHMTVSTATAIIDGEETPLTFTEMSAEDAPSGVANLTSETVLPAGKATLRLAYETPYNQSLNSAYQVKRGGEGYIVTQFEPLGAREAFPSFDEPKYKVPFTLSITAPESDFVYANTPEVGTSTTAEGWIKHDFATTRPLPTYLVAFGAGPYDVNDFGDIPPNSVRKTPLAQRGITAQGSGDEIAFGLKGTEAILTALEEYFGTPYPYEKLDIIAAPEYAFGAMENPGAIVYREYLMLMDESSPLSQKRAYNRVHSHELAHQWFGNLVTPVWWEDIWLNEAFATWMGNKAIMDQFDGITYRKGGGVLDMFESYVGEEAFQKGVRLHMERYADDVATGDDFFQSIADGSGNPDVVDAMKSFVDQPGLPLVKGKMSFEGGNTNVTFTQSRYAPLGSKTKQGQSWQIPVCAKFGYGDTSIKKCELMKDRSVTLSSKDKADWVMPNENGSGYYRFTLDTEGWASLVSNIDKLNTREALSTQDSLVAAFRAGEVESSVFLKGLEAFAKHPEYDVASGAGALLGFMDSELDAEDGVAKLVNDMFAERYAANVGKDTVEGNLLVPTLASRLVYLGQDKKLTADMAAKGAAYLGLSGKADKKAVAPNLAGLALAQAMKANGEAAYGPLLEMASNGSAFEKGAALGALSATTDKSIADKLRGLSLAEDSPLTGRQANALVGGLIRSDMHGEDTWNWLKENFAVFVERKVPDVRLGGMPGFGGGFCSAERRDEVSAFFKSQADIIPGYERSLAQTVERIELCAALKNAKADELTAALKAR